MHSSTMCTDLSLTVCWRLLPGGPGGSRPGGVWFHGGVWSQGGSGPGGVSAPGGCLLWGAVVSQHALRQTPSPDPPMDRITDACKNITLTQLRCGR